MHPVSHYRFLACFIAFFFLAATVGLAWWGSETVRQTGTQQYAQTEGVITDSYTTVRHRKRITTHQAHVSYSYDVAGTRYNSRRFAYAHDGPVEDHKDWVRAHPPGASVTVYYNPDSPQASTLRRGIFWMDFVAPGVMLASLFLTGGLFGWAMSKLRHAQHAGGLPVFQLSASSWAVSLTSDGTWVTAGAVGAVMAMTGTILYGITEPASVAALLVGQAGVVGVCSLITLGTFRLARHLRARRKKWLVVDGTHQTLLVPKGNARDAATLYGFGRIGGFQVEKITTRSGNKIYTEYQVSITGEESGSRFSTPVHAFSNQFEAESLAKWLEERVGIRRAA